MSEPPSSPARAQTFTPADRITEMNKIDASISTLLSSASSAIAILSNTSGQTNLPSAQAAFTEHASAYFSTLSDIEVKLRRQVYALEEAGLIQPGEDKDAKLGKSLSSSTGDAAARGAGGPLDSSWLNARASDKVGEGMRKELLAQAHDFVDQLSARKVHPRPSDTTKEQDGVDQAMQIDTSDG